METLVTYLREETTIQQRGLLTAIWDYFCKNRKWISTRLFHYNNGGKLVIRPALEQLGGSVVQEEPDGFGGSLYQLTLLGVLLTENGEQYENLLVQYLDYMTNIEPLCIAISSQEVGRVLNLDSEQIILLGNLVNLGSMFSRNASNLGRDQWMAGVLDDVEDIPKDRSAYVQKQAVKFYFPDTPLSLNERQQYFAARRWKAAHTAEQTVALHKLLSLVENSSSSDEKGKALEELMCQLFESIPGFTIYPRIRTRTEEIDLVIINKNENTRFREEKLFLIVECKNWSKKCGKNEFVIFQQKIANRHKRCSLGFFISWNGFSETFHMEHSRGSHKEILIIPLTGEDIRCAVTNNNFYHVLGQAYDKAVLS